MGTIELGSQGDYKDQRNSYFSKYFINSSKTKKNPHRYKRLALMFTSHYFSFRTHSATFSWTVEQLSRNRQFYTLVLLGWVFQDCSGSCPLSSVAQKKQQGHQNNSPTLHTHKDTYTTQQGSYHNLRWGKEIGYVGKKPRGVLEVMKYASPC